MGVEPIRLAIWGAGIFTRTAHIPSILALGDRYKIVAICSRTEASAKEAAAVVPYEVDILTDPDAMLAREDIEAVDIVLPIALLPDAVIKALAAGKHVISEKPVAPTVAAGKELLQRAADYREYHWMVAENYRYDPATVRAAELVRLEKQIGRPLVCDWSVYIDLGPQNPYYHTSWRRDESFPGGFVLDAGVHYIATLRYILGEIDAVSAQSAAFRPDLPPLDTLAATLHFTRGVVGSFLITFSAGASWPMPLHIVGQRGTITTQRNLLEYQRHGDQIHRLPLDERQGVELEFEAFADTLRNGVPHRNSPVQALQDVAVIEAMLKSAATGQRVAVERLVP
ncbi:MAG: gfo/Idh/MocA family oxidoreductase [Chloroflexi bacterium]|nr:MAG: gfo/Idh/MocA family oxidoreductase [Chloroflexota bacterium]